MSAELESLIAQIGANNGLTDTAVKRDLLNYGDDAAVAIVKGLPELSLNGQRGAMWLLVELMAIDAIDVVRGYMESDDMRLRNGSRTAYEALSALSAMMDEGDDLRTRVYKLAKGLDERDDIGTMSEDTLREMGASIAPILMELLVDERVNDDEYRKIVQVLKTIDDPATYQPLLETLANETVQKRKLILHAMLKYTLSGADLKQLERYYKAHMEEGVRQSVKASAEKMRQQRTTSLQNRLSSPDAITRLEARNELRQTASDQQAVLAEEMERRIKALKKKDPMDNPAFETLVSLKELGRLREIATTHEVLTVRNRAQQAVDYLENPPTGVNRVSEPEIDAVTRQQIEGHLATLDGKDAVARSTAREGLRRMGDVVVPFLINKLADHRTRHPHEILWALGYFADHTQAKRVIQSLQGHSDLKLARMAQRLIRADL